MPVISTIGRRSWKPRTVIWAMYAVLIVGAVSMIYPMLLMLSGSVKSETDFVWITPVPRYFWDDDVLWMKYVESKYARIRDAETALHEFIGSWRRIRPPEPDAEEARRAAVFIDFRADTDWPDEWFMLGHARSEKILEKNGRRFRRMLRERYGDVAAYSRAAGVRYNSWSQIGPPLPAYTERRFDFPGTPEFDLYERLKRRVPPADRVVVNLDGAFWNLYLRPQWSDIEAYNRAHGTAHESYRQVLLATRPPASGRARDDWERFVRYDLNAAYIRVDPVLAAAYRDFLASRYDGAIAELNASWGTGYADFAQIDLPQGLPDSTGAQVNYAEFLKDADACPLEMLSVEGPRQAFERYLARRRGVAPGEIVPRALPIAAVDHADFEQQTGALRRQFIKGNYLNVLDFILLHGHGIRNTAIFCGLMILVTLVVNPLAAYALSRYKPPGTYKILLFCMATMAFPPEVTMIPGFLLLKRFPLIGLGVGVATGLVAAILIGRWLPRLSDAARGIGAGAIGIAAGFWLLPMLFGDAATSVSLLNTFWALILPSAANGFFIFLLKGFFDSLPQELYEAAEIDGAGEWSKFWIITMSLSKPILAVLALGAFNAAYSEFMMALVIIPDKDMWTLMIWLFQLQGMSHVTVVYASLVIAAIPTFVIFLLCQNIIIRGIVVPVEK